MKRESKGILLIVILFIILFFANIIEAKGAIYDAYINGGTNPGKEFETISNWTGHTPFTISNDNNSNNFDEFNVSYSTNLHISGYVRLDGDLNLLNWGNLYVDDNSILIINGDFDIGDCSDVYLGKNANLYIKGNLVTHDIADNYWYVRFNQDNNSNIVVEKNLVSYWSRREWGSYQYNSNAVVRLKTSGNSDFYVFGTTTGPIYKDNGNSSQTKHVDAQSVIDDVETYELEENELSITIADIEHAITVEYDCETLNIGFNETYIVSEDEEYCFLNLDYGATLIVENGAKLTLTEENNISKGLIYNYGEIDVSKFTFNYGYVSNHGDVLFYNAGDIKGDEVNLYMTGQSQGNKSYLTLNCGSSITADTVRLSTNEPSFKMNGEISSSKLTMYNGQGYLYSGNLVFDACSYVNVDTLQIDGNINNIKIYGHIIADEVISSKTMVVSDDEENNTSGILTIGGSISNNIKYVVTKKSIMNLCYNPNKSNRELYESNTWENNSKLLIANNADNMGFCLGILLYLTNSDTGWDNEWTPEDESDINDNVIRENPYYDVRNNQNNGNALKAKSAIAAYSSYEDCMNEKNMAIFLPISLTYFKINGNKFEWKTESETNNDFFVVEYSSNGTDFTECTYQISSASTTGYTYTAEPIIDISGSLFSYFRLKQVDYDGNFSYSDIIVKSYKAEQQRQQFLRANILGQYSDKNSNIRVHNGELRYITK